MDGQESYILYKNGEQYGSPFTSKRSLESAIKILQGFEPSATFLVEVYVTQFNHSFLVVPEIGKSE